MIKSACFLITLHIYRYWKIELNMIINLKFANENEVIALKANDDFFFSCPDNKKL